MRVARISLFQKNAEPSLIDRSQDYEPLVLRRFEILECPRSDQCSSISWKKAKCWSRKGAHTALKYLMRHLVMSSYHQMTEEEAYLFILDHVKNDRLLWGVTEEDWEAREDLRQQWEARERLRQQRPRRLARDQTGWCFNCCKRRRLA